MTTSRVSSEAEATKAKLDKWWGGGVISNTEASAQQRKQPNAYQQLYKLKNKKTSIQLKMGNTQFSKEEKQLSC